MDLEQAIRINPKLVNQLFSEVISGFKEGAFSAIPVYTFPITEVADAFRYMSKAQHIGKITVSSDVAEAEVVCPPKKPPVKFDATYLVTGGVKGFGCTLAVWLREQGARHIVFVSRSNAASPEALEIINEFKMHGCIVKVLTADVADAKQLQKVLAEIEVTMPPLRNFFISNPASGVPDHCLSAYEGEPGPANTYCASATSCKPFSVASTSPALISVRPATSSATLMLVLKYSTALVASSGAFS